MIKFMESGENTVIVWNETEDLSIDKPHDSEEFQGLVEQKGYTEIEKRRMFLNVLTNNVGLMN